LEATALTSFIGSDWMAQLLLDIGHITYNLRRETTTEPRTDQQGACTLITVLRTTQQGHPITRKAGNLKEVIVTDLLVMDYHSQLRPVQKRPAASMVCQMTHLKVMVRRHIMSTVTMMIITSRLQLRQYQCQYQPRPFGQLMAIQGMALSA
jgi:hypothetical protein